MKSMYRSILGGGAGLALAVTAVLAGSCASTEPAGAASSAPAESSASASSAASAAPAASAPAEEKRAAGNTGGLAKIDMSRWQYSEAGDVYYQVGIRYVENPADAAYETLGVFVPGAYLNATANGDGTYTATVNRTAKVNGYTAGSAPVVIPVETPGYSAMAAPTGYSPDIADFTKAGFVYLFAGCRGRDQGAPTGIVDLKAAIRYFRYTADRLPGDSEKLFSFGMSGGGAQSALLGATGDSELYSPYLKAVGAIESESDAILGSMDWCPITNLDVANEAYEWNMGATRTGLDEQTQALSDGLTDAFASAVNRMGLKDDEGRALTLSQSADGRWQAGSYYEWIKAEVERSLNNFLADTAFPYDPSAQTETGGFGGRGGGRGGMPPAGAFPGGGADFAQIDNIRRTAASGGVTLSGTYRTAQDYIDALNADGEWVRYDAATNTAVITSLADFARAVKPATKNVGAFDDLDRTQGENTLFGYNEGRGAHWDAVMARLLQGTDYADSYAADIARRDSLGYTVQTRINMYTPLYYLLPSYGGYGKSSVARYWRIRSGIFQGDTSVTTEASLAQALRNYGIRAEDVDFEMVWGMKHVKAERAGDSTANFIAWVQACTKR